MVKAMPKAGEVAGYVVLLEDATGRPTVDWDATVHETRSLGTAEVKQARAEGFEDARLGVVLVVDGDGI